MVPLKKMALLHEICDKLLTEDHDIVGLHFERHSTLAYLAIYKELAALVLESVLLFQEA